MTKRRGFLVVFEGIDGSGKSTQARILAERLQMKSYETCLLREPSDSVWGRKIREKALRNHSVSPEEELQFFQMDRRENVEKNIKPAMADGKIVILDRYYFSTMAYQGAKGIEVERIRRLNQRFAVPPDIVFILEIAPEEGLARIKDRAVKNPLFEREDYLRKVDQIFRGLAGPEFVHLDGRRMENELAVSIEKDVLRRLKRKVSV